MGTVVAVYSEKRRRFFYCGGKFELLPDGMRRLLASPYRYCIGGNYFYSPAADDDLSETDRLCWVRDREFMGVEALNDAIASGEDLSGLDVQIGNTYTKRRHEIDGKFLEVEQFVSEELYEKLRKNPEALPNVSKTDFEALCAELFVRKGFEVDLFRPTNDGGIDFLAVKGDLLDPTIFAVQVKQPEVRKGKPRKSLGRPVLQQIYGAAKAWDMDGAIAISGSTFSPQAKRFAENKPQEMRLHDGADVLSWIKKYRWNDNE